MGHYYAKFKTWGLMAVRQKQNGNDRVKVTVTVSGTDHQIYPEYPQPRHVGIELKLVRAALRKALAMVDPREFAKQAKGDVMKPIEIERAQQSERELALALADAEFEAGTRTRRPPGYWKRFEQRKSAAERHMAQRETARAARRSQYYKHKAGGVPI